jgi:hypothetical protein
MQESKLGIVATSDDMLEVKSFDQCGARTLGVSKRFASGFGKSSIGLCVDYAFIRTHCFDQWDEEHASASDVNMDISDAVHFDPDSRNEGEDV